MSEANDTNLYLIFAFGNPIPVPVHGWAFAIAHFYRLYSGATAAWNTPYRMHCLNNDERFNFQDITREWQYLGWPFPGCAK